MKIWKRNIIKINYDCTIFLWKFNKNYFIYLDSDFFLSDALSLYYQKYTCETSKYRTVFSLQQMIESMSSFLMVQIPGIIERLQLIRIVDIFKSLYLQATKSRIQMTFQITKISSKK